MPMLLRSKLHRMPTLPNVPATSLPVARRQSNATLALSHWLLSLYERDVVLHRAQRILGVGDFTVRGLCRMVGPRRHGAYLRSCCNLHEGPPGKPPLPASTAPVSLRQRWIAATLAGAVYALVMYRTNRLSDAIVAHAASNALIVLWVITAQQRSLL